MSEEQSFEPRIEIAKLQQKIGEIKKEMGTVLIGQEKVVDLMITALLSKGHIMIEGVPGIAKTLAAKLLATCTSTQFSRIQFTPDLMPSDVLGTSVFNLKSSEFVFNKGPIFANLILIDEINRAPAKTQSALFEVMEEKQVTIDGQTYPMDLPFIVMATQNPIEHEGTYKLPEAQLDRFMFKIVMDYPTAEEEVSILERFNQNSLENTMQKVKQVINNKDLIEMQGIVSQVHAEQRLLKYIAQIIEETRQHNAFYLGGSPRAGLAILSGAKGWASIQGRDFITPDDIKIITYPALSHRLLLTAEKEMEGVKTEQILEKILEKIEVPR
ncbi:MAG: MoxR family ATPase [Calditrichaeota bacterium]|nr:MAG: MoxR family ATPase [Calditrichota bacterium]MBL1205372.1 MoxR family ATPase [Calditrichota bacterium]NOG45201.1 MoxR family ATPase [Calditrichota bacterium]